MRTEKLPSARLVPRLTTLLLTLALSACGPGPLADLPTNSSVYVEMPDGVRLAVDVWLPDDLGRRGRVPTLASFTRYWRAPAATPTAEAVELMRDAGYAFVIADNRGSGASFGNREAVWSTCETRDYRHVVDWIADQPWSNGNVASIGTSYLGNTAENATFDPSPHLKAAVPRFTDFDWYASLLYPGGMRNLIITSDWGEGVMAMDQNRLPGERTGENVLGRRPPDATWTGVKPVDADTTGALVAAAVAEHDNLHITDFFRDVHFRDQVPTATAMEDGCENMVTPYRFREAAQRNAIPTFHWGSWMDAGTAAGVLARFAGYDMPARYVIGAWTHGAYYDADPFKPRDTPVSPSVAGQFGQIFEFLEPYMFGGAPPEPVAPVLDYFTMGEDVWKRTSSWPPTGSTTQDWYFGANGTLQRDPPANSAGRDRYRVSFDVGGGSETRWSTQLGGTEVFYGNRAAADSLLLTYTSPPLEAPLEITGHPVVEMALATTHNDGAVIAYLEIVHADGSVTMITEGQLRLIHHALSAEAPYPTFGPHHSYLEADALPMVPWEATPVSFTMLPTSVLVKAGDRLRIAIAGHDRDTFERAPAEGQPLLTVYRNAAYPSFVRLPVVAR